MENTETLSQKAKDFIKMFATETNEAGEIVAYDFDAFSKAVEELKKFKAEANKANKANKAKANSAEKAEAAEAGKTYYLSLKDGDVFKVKRGEEILEVVKKASKAEDPKIATGTWVSKPVELKTASARISFDKIVVE